MDRLVKRIAYARPHLHTPKIGLSTGTSSQSDIGSSVFNKKAYHLSPPGRLLLITKAEIEAKKWWYFDISKN